MPFTPIEVSPLSQLIPVRIQLDPPLVESGPCEAREAGEKNRAASVEEGVVATADQDEELRSEIKVGVGGGATKENEERERELAEEIESREGREKM
ncbi:hypothetical protein CDL15_Pgr015490 [Punica granatum]|uniref:Uncharacterized protein n=1 Tax=Punica granatum TaxID=22663 RepID=A0A218VZQ9_PUNGR|nr:hypothetical protein CDL15_Pgr015490 [Punica granatum]